MAQNITRNLVAGAALATATLAVTVASTGTGPDCHRLAATGPDMHHFALSIDPGSFHHYA